MKILVSVKRAIDYNVRIQVAPDGSGVVKNGVKHSMNPFDEIAVEQAIRWKEDGTATEVVAVAIGDDAVAEQLRTALAFGCDRAIHVKTDDEVQPLTAGAPVPAHSAGSGVSTHLAELVEERAELDARIRLLGDG